ncbi:threonine synthase [Acidaminobacter sp. JC074]|uniref:threonine synthase n=1 Tax=Acidaminobacter sp. JC074 TaxID=2530199 RepID=UPI001F0DE852|nr:threonine synthase [Acidaminobacter sp. JC074]MCH4889754.1 threonine synthase [Acidaminobacter sp. JC074]
MHKLRCITCEKVYDPQKGRYTCDDCGPLLGTLEVLYDYESIKLEKNFKKKASMFQFAELLPVSSHTPLDDFIGGTPLMTFDHVFGYDKLMIKNDGMNLSASYKDRASIIAVNRAIEEGNDHIFCASTGNAASSLALLNAHTPIKTTIFVPSTIPSGKLAQLMVAGAHIFPIQASYDEVFDLSLEIGLKNGWYTRNSAINPYLLEGKKTGAFEIIVQNNYESPDYVFVGVGDGTIISGLCKGFKEFYDLGLIDNLPKVIGVQAENASTLKKVFEGHDLFVEDVQTIADSISVGNPRDVVKACKYLKENGGYFMSVTDEEIVKSIELLASTTGIFSEPAGAVTLAGLLKSDIPKDKSICLVITGNGLKDTSNIKITEVKSYTKEEVYEYFRKEHS